MAQGLHLSQRMALSQVLAPQLQQSLALLQAPTLELKALIEQELQLNPVLEELGASEQTQEQKDNGEQDEELRSLDPTEPPADTQYDSTKESDPNEPVDDFQAEFDKLVQLDQEWRDFYSQTNLPVRSNQDEEERRQYMLDSVVANPSLQEHLQDQVRLSEIRPDQKSVAEMIIGNIDEKGYLQSSVQELAFSTNIDPSKILEVLKIIQSFHPPGIGARDLRECLMLQLERDDRKSSLEYQIVDRFMDALGKRRLPEIARGLSTTIDQVQEAMARISQLEPKPGRDFAPDSNIYITPEVFVQKLDGEYLVTNNQDHLPHIRISNTYKDMMSQAGGNSEVREYIRDKIRAGKFLIKSLHQRQETILNIAREIVSRQKEFMEKGISHLRPMTMAQVAEVVGVHETTVSRAVSGKYMECPQGIFEMKYFFTSGIQTGSGSDVSNTSVKGLISEMIKKEDPRHPLSDEEIVNRLLQKDIKIARRTVAKYRSELNVLPSHLRRAYA